MRAILTEAYVFAFFCFQISTKGTLPRKQILIKNLFVEILFIISHRLSYITLSQKKEHYLYRNAAFFFLRFDLANWKKVYLINAVYFF